MVGYVTFIYSNLTVIKNLTVQATEIQWLSEKIPMTVNQRVLGSSPRGGAKALQRCRAFFMSKSYSSQIY